MKRPSRIRSSVRSCSRVRRASRSSGSALAQAPRAKGFDDFRLVRTRNIFDPNRRAMRTETPRDARSSASQIARANTLSLTGTMVTEGRTLAFFTGSRSEYSKVIGVGDTVAEHKVKAITATQVELEHGGKTTVLAVGKLLTLEGTCRCSGRFRAAHPAHRPMRPPAAPADAATAPASTNDKSEVLRRMMERRAKEMSK